MTQWKAAVIVVAISSGLTLAFVAILALVLSDKPDEIRLPLLVVAAVAGLLSSLALVVAVFAIYQLANRRFALGLPDGSVRAIIALLLIVLFSTTTVFLTVRLKDTNAGAPVVDFAKQLLTILGTLMTSVASFYFGTKAVSDGARVLREPPLDSQPPAARVSITPEGTAGGAAQANRPEESAGGEQSPGVASAKREDDAQARELFTKAMTVQCPICYTQSLVPLVGCCPVCAAPIDGASQYPAS